MKKQKMIPKQNSVKSVKPKKIGKEKVTKLKPQKELLTKQLIAIDNKTNVEVVKTSQVPSKKKYVMPSKSITEELVNSSLKALQELTIQYQKKNKLLEDESPIFMEINCIKIQNTSGNIKFILPHSTVATTSEVCLITPDLKKGRKVDHEPTIDHWQDLLRNAGVTSIKTVLPMRQLRVEYDQFELKRRLLTQHDFIMVDTRVLSHVSHVLGKMFFKKHNMLIPVRVNENGNLEKDIDVGLHTAMLRLNEGATSTITVGHTAMAQEKVKENILALVKQLREKYPGGEANIRSISLKLPLSLALPLYVTLRSSSLINVPKLKQKKPKHFTVVEDELSTIPGSRVKVAPDGTVHVIKSKMSKRNNENDVTEDEIQEESGSDNEED